MNSLNNHIHINSVLSVH